VCWMIGKREGGWIQIQHRAEIWFDVSALFCQLIYDEYTIGGYMSRQGHPYMLRLRK